MRPLVPRQLTPYQLNFQYQEQGRTKQALVKVVLCPKCASKLTWKKDQDKLARGEQIDTDKGKGTFRMPEEDEYIEKSRTNSDTLVGDERVRSRRSRSRSPQRERQRKHETSKRSRHDSPGRNDASSSKMSEIRQGDSTSKPRIRTVITSLMGKYYEAILDGSKTWEGRTNAPRYATLRPGDEFIFHHAEDASKPAFTALILDVRKFDNFHDMLEGSVQDFLPGLQTLQEAIDVYENIPGYRDQVKEHGAAAFHIKVIDRGNKHERP